MNDPTELSSAGVECYRNGQYQKAIEHFTNAIETLNASGQVINPLYLQWFYYNRGISYTEVGDYRRAIEDLSVAQRLNPTDGDTYNERGFAYIQAGDIESAIADFLRAIKINPTNLKFRNNFLKAQRLNQEEPARTTWNCPKCKRKLRQFDKYPTGVRAMGTDSVGRPVPYEIYGIIFNCDECDQTYFTVDQRGELTEKILTSHLSRWGLIEPVADEHGQLLADEHGQLLFEGYPLRTDNPPYREP